MDIERIIAKLNNLINDAQAKQQSLNDLHVEAEKMNKNVEESANKTTSTLKAFDDSVELFIKCSQEWWKRFYDMHSSVIVQNEITALKKRIADANNDLKKYELICSKSYSDDIKALSDEISKKGKVDDVFKRKIIRAAQKAMCYEVCILLDRKGWKLKGFDDREDWGLHLCPNGARGSRFHYLFMLTNPFGYYDLKKSLEGAPDYYKRTLLSQNKIQSIIQKHHLKNTSNPVDEMKTILGDALGKVVEIPVRISNMQELLNKDEKLYIIVKNGEQAFMQQSFDDISQLREYKGEYIEQLKTKLVKTPSYKQHQQLLDRLADSVFDFKKVDSFVSNDRNQLKDQLLAVEKDAKDKQETVETQVQFVQQELDSILKEIGKHFTDCNEELNKGTDKLNGDTSYNLAMLYYNGKWVEKDLTRALELFKISYDKGNDKAAILLGEIYHDGNGVEPDYAEAYRYFKEASDEGYVYATKELAIMYQNGEYVKKNVEEATRLFQIAADYGDTYAAAETGYSYYSGRGVQQDYEKAYKYLKMAMDDGILWSIKIVANMYKAGLYLKQDDKEAMRLYKIVADECADLYSIEEVASGYYCGDGVQKDYEQAYKYLQMAYKKGSAYASRILAYMYQHGYYVEQDIKKSFMFAKEAADKGDANACETLGVYYDNGKGVEKNYEKAFFYLKKASDAGLAHATANLGIMYRNGHYVKTDYHEAFRLFEKAAKSNSAWGYYNMGESYRLGQGLKRDLKKAEKLYCVAASLGLKQAEEKVHELNSDLNSHSEIIEAGKEFIEDFIKDRIEDCLSDMISDAVDKILDEDGSIIGEFVGDAVAHGIMAAFDN